MGELDFGEFLEQTTFLGVSLGELLGKAVLLAVVCLVSKIVGHMLGRLTRRLLDKTRVPSVSFLVNMMRAVVWSLALITVLEPVFGIQPTAFVAALGVGSVTLSLGMQDTVSNIIGGLALMMTRMIEPGDVIRFGDFTGTVADINWRCTYVVDSYGQVNLIPNSIISKTAVVKLSAATKNCCVLPLVIAFGTDLEAARADLIRVADEVLGEWVDKQRDVWITVLSLDGGGGIISQASVPLMGGVSLDHARTRLAQAVCQRDWVKKP